MITVKLALALVAVLSRSSASVAAAPPKCTSYRNDSGDRLAFVSDGENTVIYAPAKKAAQTCDWARLGDDGYTPSIDCGTGQLQSHFIFAGSRVATMDQGLLVLLDTQDVFYLEPVCAAPAPADIQAQPVSPLDLHMPAQGSFFQPLN